MANKLQDKWGVGGIQFILIICTFAIGGSLSGYGAKQVMNFLDLEKGVIWWICYILVVTTLWPICVITVSVFFGQYSFFKKYLQKIGKRIIS